MYSLQEIRGNVVDPAAGTIMPARVEIAAGRIQSISPEWASFDTYLLPGFVDAHVHIESSMLPPSEFARAALCRGTVAVVADPHEIANVLGVAGIEYMLQDSARAPMRFGFGAPSCVPATPFETSGAQLGPEEVGALLARPEITHLGEVMNVPGVLGLDEGMRAMFGAARWYGKPIDGHAPGLLGEPLRRYASAGVETDHECATLAEARARVAMGMKMLIREGSAARSFDTLVPVLGESHDLCMLCSDDGHPEDLARGHIDVLVRRAVARGIDVMKVLRAACVNPVLHYDLDVGLLRPGQRADFIEVSSLGGFGVLRTVIDGQVVAERGQPLLPHQPVTCPNRFAATPRAPGDFALPARVGKLAVIVAHDGKLATDRVEMTPRVARGLAVADVTRDLLKITVVNRYADAPPAVAFVRGFGLLRGAMASSVAHDSHNIVAVGADDESLCRAVNLVIEHRGGIAVVDPGRSDGDAVLPLPIAGLMSDRPFDEVARAYEALGARVARLGSGLRAPFMTLSFMALLVIPSLKLSDRGLYDFASSSLIEPFVAPGT